MLSPTGAKRSSFMPNHEAGGEAIRTQFFQATLDVRLLGRRYAPRGAAAASRYRVGGPWRCRRRSEAIQLQSDMIHHESTVGCIQRKVDAPDLVGLDAIPDLDVWGLVQLGAFEGEVP